MMQLLDFPDELLCKIFEYLSLFDALHAFNNINDRLNRILTPFKHQIDLTSISFEQFTYYVNTVSPLLSQDHQLKMIKLGDRRATGQVQLFNNLVSCSSMFEHYKYVEHIVLQSIQINELDEFINQYLLKLSNLVNLSIETESIADNDYPKLNRMILNLFVNLTNLIKFSIKIPSGLSLSTLSNQIQFHSLVYIKINVKLQTDILILIQCIPNIEQLFVYIGWLTDHDQQTVKILKETPSTFLSRLKKFSLSIGSIISFSFGEFQQILSRILNPQLSASFSLFISNDFTPKDNLFDLIDGRQWEKFLRTYSTLNQFQLSFRLSNETNPFPIEYFQSDFYQKKNWLFSYLKFSQKNSSIFYSIPYKFKQSFDLLIDNEILSDHLPLNYTPTLLLYSMNYQIAQCDDFILKYFPFIEKLSLKELNFKNSNPLNLLSLHTVQIERADQIDLSNIHRLFPLINTLFLSCSSIVDVTNMPQFERITELHLKDISERNLTDVLIYVNQFPNIRFLYLDIYNRRLSSQYLIENINEIIERLQFLIYFELHLQHTTQLSENFFDDLNLRVKRRSTRTISHDIMIYLWC